jgi:transcriptional regulator with XRE-family HTH domain
VDALYTESDLEGMVKKDTLLQFGKRVRERRERLGLSQEELADRAQFDRTYISMVERGKRNLSLLNICRFATVLGTTPSALLDGI